MSRHYFSVVVYDTILVSETERQMVSTSLRLPPDAKAFIEAEARENASSQNSEIVRAIRERMKAKGPAEAATTPDRGHNKNLEDRCL